MKRLKINNDDWHVVKTNKKRLGQGMAKMREVITTYAIEVQNRKNCLPNDWRSRLLK